MIQKLITKPYLTILPVLILVCQFASAQFHWGVKAGANISSTFIQGYTSPYAIKCNVGLFGESNLGNRFFLLTELQYSQKGNYSYQTDLASLFETLTLRLNYLTMPILAGIRAWKKFELVLGPELGYLLQMEYKYPEGPARSFLNEYRRFDIGGAAGARYLFSSRLGIEFRYILGLIGTMKPEINLQGYTATTTEKYNPNNTVFQLDIFFRVGK